MSLAFIRGRASGRLPRRQWQRSQAESDTRSEAAAGLHLRAAGC